MSSSPTLAKQYIEQRGEGYWIEGTRISLDSIVYAFLDGETPENIAQNFPLLTLEQVYGAIAFYLANRDLIDAYLATEAEKFEELRQTLQQKNPTLHQKLMSAQKQKQRES